MVNGKFARHLGLIHGVFPRTDPKKGQLSSVLSLLVTSTSADLPVVIPTRPFLFISSDPRPRGHLPPFTDGKTRLGGPQCPHTDTQQGAELPPHIQACLTPKASVLWTPPNCPSDSQRKQSLNFRKDLSSPCCWPGSPGTWTSP